MQAIILAAGMGRRLKNLTKENTKCMVKVGDTTLIERMLCQIDCHHLSRIVIVVGYQGNKLKDFIATLHIKTPVLYVYNDIFDKTNNIYSLALAKEYLCQDDTILFESDLIFEDSVLDVLLEDPRETLALVDHYQSWMDGTCMMIDANDRIEMIVSQDNFKFSEAENYYKTVNIYKFSKDFSKSYYVPFLNAYMQVLGNNIYYEQVLKVITLLKNSPIRAKKLNGQKWYEIDDIQDLDIAESLFARTRQEKMSLLKRRYGGYWRYPGMIDFCYLVNPYFPTSKMIDEMETYLSPLLRSYPSGMQVNTLLASKKFSVESRNIVVANGAAELIKILLRGFSGRLGIIRPTFEEYPNCYTNEKLVEFRPNGKDFRYHAEDIISFFEDKEIESMIIINPDNPSGNYMNVKELFDLLDWAKKHNIRLVVDESFSDFSDEENNTLIEQTTLDKYTNLCVVKSISKCYGVPGLRLGIMASGDMDLVDRIKSDLPIWDINSLAEFYMQIEGKYTNDYQSSLKKMRLERRYLIEELKKIPGIRPIESQANFLMAELTGEISARELSEILLEKYDLLIKDLSEKIKDGQYIRLSIRNRADNDKLIFALKNELSVM